MAKASDNEFPSVLLAEGTTPATPAAGNARLFVDSADGLLKWVDDAGVVTSAGGASALDDLSDVDLTGEADGDFLSRVAGVWTPVDAPSGGSSNPPLMVELASNFTATTSFVTALSGTFTPTGTAIRAAAMGNGLCTGSATPFFQVVRDNGAGGAGATLPMGSFAALSAENSFAVARKFTGLTPGLPYAIQVQIKQSAGSGSFVCRPSSFPSDEQMSAIFEDCV